MALKTCAACLHPERNDLDEALDRGESYRELKERFRVPIGAMKRHRKAHLQKATAPTAATIAAEEVHLPVPDLSDFPESIEALQEAGDLGGSTGARLLEDETGKLFVAKRGANAGQMLEEHAANRIYHVLGTPVPRCKFCNTPEGPLQLAEYIEGVQLRYLGGDDWEGLVEKAREHFAADALLANWDVAGTAEDNLILASDGRVYRVDNGGALRYRARGRQKKASEFSAVVAELDTMRSGNAAAGVVFDELSDGAVAAQIQRLVERRGLVLAAAPEELRETLVERLGYMEGWARICAAPEVFLRLGDLPEDGQSFNTVEGVHEDGVSCYRGRRIPGGSLRFELPFDPALSSSIKTLIGLMLTGRPLYLASGTYVGEGIDGEPLLENATLAPVSPSSRIELPAWMGDEGKRFAEGWSRWRFTAGAKAFPTRQHRERDCWGRLEEQAARVLAAASLRFDGAPLEQEEQSRRAKSARRMLRHWAGRK